MLAFWGKLGGVDDTECRLIAPWHPLGSLASRFPRWCGCLTSHFTDCLSVSNILPGRKNSKKSSAQYRQQLKSAVSLITDLDDALKNGSPDKRAVTLRRITDLFLNEADRLNEQQIAVFDDVLVHLAQRIEARVLVELSTCLAPVANAPIETVRRLAKDDEIAVARPVLSQSSRLTESDLVEIAKSKSQGHLLAISGRSLLSEAVTDALIERGNGKVTRRLAGNSGARFSKSGYDAIVENAGRDSTLAEKLALRLDIPLQLLRKLLARATELVRSRLLASASREKRDQIQQVLTSIADEVGQEATGPRDYVASEGLVQELNRNGKLNEKVLGSFINERKYEEMTSTLALFCGAPVEFIERLLKRVQPESLIVACKSAKLSWSTVREILKMRFSHHSTSDEELDEAKSIFLALSQANAQRTFRFWLVQEKMTKRASLEPTR
jgi:uncharacterized protein (DUF2336 family)